MNQQVMNQQGMNLRNENGGVTAEFAVTLPAVLIVLAIIIGAITLATHKITLTSAVHDIARLEARGDSNLAKVRQNQMPPTVTLQRSTTAGVLCITGKQTPGRGILRAIEIQAIGCAALNPQE